MQVEKFYREDGTLFYEEYTIWFNDQKKYKREHEFMPKLLMYDKNGNMIIEQYYKVLKDEHLSKLLIEEIEGKSKIDYKKLPLTNEIHYKNNKIHRDDGPAVIEYYDNGNKRSECYYKDGKKHNDKGPGFISYHEDGRIKNKTYWLNGKKVKDALQIAILETPETL